jgi:hypothetical protein
MSHLTALEKQDAAYGFARPHHRCPDCDRDVAAIAAERDALRRILGPRPAKTRAAWWTVPAAAALLAGLAWMMRPQDAPKEPAPARQEDFARRLARELSSPSAHKRAIAMSALRAMGGAAIPALDAAGTKEAKALADELRDPNPAISRRLKEFKFSISLKDAPLATMMEFIRDFAELNILIDPQTGAADKLVSIAVADTSLAEMFETVLKPLGLVAAPTADGVLLITTPERAPGATALAPLRLKAPAPPEIDRLIADLASDSIETREAAMKALCVEGAEARLWAALDHRDTEVASRAAEVLKRLYAPAPRAGTKLPSKHVAGVDCKDMRLDDIVRAAADLPAALEPGLEQEKASFSVKDVALDKALALLLDPRRLRTDVVHGVLYVSRSGVVRTAPGEGLFWTEPKRAAELSALLNRVADGDATSADALVATGAIDAVRYAQRVFGAERLEAVARRMLDQTKLWTADEPPAWKRSDSPLRRTLEEKKVSFDSLDADLSDVLAKLSKDAGVELALAAAESKVTLRLKDVSLGVALEFLARPRGMQARIEGGRVVVR